jgi:hypothetical protein
MDLKKPAISVLAVLMITASGIGCSSTTPPSSSEAVNLAADTCFNVRDVLSFEALHDKYVYVKCRRGKSYLLTMENICLGLRNSLAIAITNDFSRVCSQDRATITYEGLGRTWPCFILRVERVEDGEAAGALVDQRTHVEKAD